MKIQPTQTVTRFPLLLQERESVGSEYLAGLSDIFQTNYVQGETVADDRIEDSTTWKAVAAQQGAIEREPCFTSTGEPAYVRDGCKYPGLFVGSKAVVRAVIGHACFSPDGNLAYTRGCRLYLARADGSQPTQIDLGEITEKQLDDLEFSPDGRHLYFCSEKVLHRYDTTNRQHETVPTADEVLEFSLAPDGRTIAYLDEFNGIHRLNLDDAIPQERDTLLARIPWRPPYGNEGFRWPASPTFSPDGSRILFTVNSTCWCDDFQDIGYARTTASLYAMGTDGGKVVQLTDDDDNCCRVAVPLPAAA